MGFGAPNPYRHTIGDNHMVNARRSIRLDGYDYTNDGAYFVTICAHERRCVFGYITNDAMMLNERGRIVETCWLEIPLHFPHVELDAYVIMPNHVGATHGSPLTTNRATSRPTIGFARRNTRPIQIVCYAADSSDLRPQCCCLAAQLLRTHYPQRGRTERHARIYRVQPGPMGV